MINCFQTGSHNTNSNMIKECFCAKTITTWFNKGTQLLAVKSRQHDREDFLLSMIK